MKTAFFFLIFISQFALADDSLLKCLGKEEAQLFKKRAQGSLLRLNQDLIAEFIQFPTYQPLKDIYYAEVCKMQNESPSYSLLKLLFKNQAQIFRDPNANQVPDFINRIPSIFLTFIAQIRTFSQSRECLEKVLPKLTRMERIILSFQNEKSSTLLFFENDQVINILNRIPYIQQELEDCEVQKQKRAEKEAEEKKRAEEKALEEETNSDLDL